MKYLKTFKIIFCLCVILTVVGLMTGIHAYNTSKTLENDLANLIDSIKEEKSFSNKNTDEIKMPPNIKPLESGSIQADLRKNNPSAKEKLSSDDEIKRIKDLVEYTRMDKLAEICDVYPDEIRGIFYKKLKEKEMNARQADLKALSYEQYQADADEYGGEVNRLYLQTFNRNLSYQNQKNKEKSESEQAIDKLLEKYPDSYATARVLYTQMSQAVRMLSKDNDKAQEYFDTLRDIQSTKPDLITMEDGMEAVPSAAYQLIGAYSRKGRVNDANNLMVFLENNYSDSIYRLRKPGTSIISFYSGKEAMDIIRSIYELNTD